MKLPYETGRDEFEAVVRRNKASDPFAITIFARTLNAAKREAGREYEVLSIRLVSKSDVPYLPAGAEI